MTFFHPILCIGNGTTPLHNVRKREQGGRKKQVHYSTAVIPTGDGLYRNVLLPENEKAGGGCCCFTGVSPAGSASVVHPAELVDQACRGLFPLGFLLCNIAYWVYYLHIATDQTDQ